jgi:hypothetical protein
MPKRKRESELDPFAAAPKLSTQSSAASLNTTPLSTTITQGTTLLKKALTFARASERQKLGRRQKAANSAPHTLLKLREEVIVLKGLDLGVVAERQLLRRLGRVKRVVGSEAWKREYGEREMEGVKGEAEGRIVGRLMGSAPVREVADVVVERVMNVLGLDTVVAGKEKAKTEEVVAKRANAPGKASDLTRVDGDQWSGSEDELDKGMESADELDSGDDIPPNKPSQHIQDVSDIEMDDSSEFSGFSDRIASSSPESEVSSSRPEITNAPLLVAKRPPKPGAKSQAKAPPAPPSSTAFLPSLMLGGYYSGSESGSEIEDIEDIDGKPRKNRRGQRERQKIAEAKFGGRAKNLLNAKEKKGRDGGWDARKGAMETGREREGSGRFNGKGRMRIARPEGTGASAIGAANSSTQGNSRRPTGANGDVLGTGPGKKESTKDNGGVMHPSWEAARKRKEQGSKITIDTGLGGGVGKKITFD